MQQDKTHPSQARGPGQPGAGWPVWPTPDDENLRQLARALTPFVRFLGPGIICAVTEDNRRMRADWSSRLEELGIDPATYLWEGSPCAFPGVRRHAGTKEIAVFKQKASASAEVPPQCLTLDDNDYPKHLWAFTFTRKKWQKRGPDGYQLAHLLDHKEFRNRWCKELDIPPGATVPKPHGLFASAANLAYVPAAFLKPTDFSSKLRSLIQRRAQQLYGEICHIVPPPLAVKTCEDPEWSLDSFEWGAPVGETDNVPEFLEFRRKRMEQLFNKRYQRK